MHLPWPSHAKHVATTCPSQAFSVGAPQFNVCDTTDWRDLWARIFGAIEAFGSLITAAPSVGVIRWPRAENE